MATFGERLKQLREENGITQIDLAKYLSLANSTISQYEANKRDPDTATIQKLADHFHVTSDFLLGRTDLKQPQTPTGLIQSGFEAYKGYLKPAGNGLYEVNLGDFLPPDILELSQDIKKLSPEQRELIKAMVSQLLGKEKDTNDK